MASPVPHPIPDAEWKEHLASIGKSPKVLAYTRGDTDGIPDEDDHIYLPKSVYIRFLDGSASRDEAQTVAHEIGHHFDANREDEDPIWDHPVIANKAVDGARAYYRSLWDAFVDAAFNKRFGTMSALDIFQLRKAPRVLWEHTEKIRAEWSDLRALETPSG